MPNYIPMLEHIDDVLVAKSSRVTGRDILDIEGVSSLTKEQQDVLIKYIDDARYVLEDNTAIVANIYVGGLVSLVAGVSCIGSYGYAYAGIPMECSIIPILCLIPSAALVSLLCTSKATGKIYKIMDFTHDLKEKYQKTLNESWQTNTLLTQD
ncbi:MAG: hypothetical protein ABIJ34_06295 [archaeon]